MRIFAAVVMSAPGTDADSPLGCDSGRVFYRWAKMVTCLVLYRPMALSAAGGQAHC